MVRGAIKSSAKNIVAHAPSAPSPQLTSGSPSRVRPAVPVSAVFCRRRWPRQPRQPLRSRRARSRTLRQQPFPARWRQWAGRVSASLVSCCRQVSPERWFRIRVSIRKDLEKAAKKSSFSLRPPRFPRWGWGSAPRLLGCKGACATRIGLTAGCFGRGAGTGLESQQPAGTFQMKGCG